jgi:hypothetical protein
MKLPKENLDYLNAHKAKMIIKILGILQLMIGFGSLLIAPIEIYCFYLFKEGGPFFYNGFGIGSFIHGLIIAQILALYAIGILFISIGYGHLSYKPWTLNLSRGSILYWIIFGVPMMVFFLPLLTMKEINTQYPILILVIIAVLLIIIIPTLLLLFYNQNNVRDLFLNRNHNDIIKKLIPARNYLLLLVYCQFILFFHIMIFYNGLFPFFGRFVTGLVGISIYSVLIILITLFIYGLFKRLRIIWTASISVFCLITISTLITIPIYQYTSIIEKLNFPKLEHHIFIKFPLKSIHLLIPVAFILIITVILILRVKEYHDK